MKKTTISLLVLCLAIGFCITLLGCGKDTDSASIRRAKLVGNENIELKKQLELKDEEIQRQKDLLTRKEKDFAEAQNQAGEATLKLMQNLVETSQQNTVLAAENLQLKEQIKQLEARLAEK